MYKEMNIQGQNKYMKNKKLKNFIFMNMGCILFSTGVYFFKIPNGFATGGVTGIGTI